MLVQKLDRSRRPRPYLHLDADLFEQVNESVVGVLPERNETLHPGVGQHLGAQDAGGVGAVDGGALKVDAVLCRLDDDVLLGVDRPADLVAGARGDAVLVTQAAQFQAIAGAGRAPL